MPISDDIYKALQAGANAGAAAASAAGANLNDDVNKFVVPHLMDISIQVASIIQKHKVGTYSDITAKALIDSEEDAIETLVETMIALSVLAAQIIVNSIIDALNAAVNAELGFAFLA